MKIIKMGDIENCTNCHQDVEVYFRDRTSGKVLGSEAFFFCEDCYHSFFDLNTFSRSRSEENDYHSATSEELPRVITINYDGENAKESLEMPQNTLEFINKDGYKIEIVQRGYIFESVKKYNLEGVLVYEKLFQSLDTPRSEFQDVRNYKVRKYDHDGKLIYESCRMGYYTKYSEACTHYTSPILEWYANGVLKSEEVPNKYEKNWDSEGYLLTHHEQGEKDIRRNWYKDVDLCLVMTNFMDYYGDYEETTNVIDREGNTWKPVFDKLGNLVPYSYNKESNATEHRIVNARFDSLYKEWNKSSLLSESLFRKIPKWRDEEQYIMDGLFKIYNHQGILVEEAILFMNHLNGVCKKWDWDTGDLRIEYHFRIGKLHGVCREWNSSGILVKEHHYEKNKFHGLCQEWSSTGILLKSHEYKDHKLEGLCSEFDEMGILKKSGIFTNGKCIQEDGKKVIIRKMNVIEPSF